MYSLAPHAQTLAQPRIQNQASLLPIAASYPPSNTTYSGPSRLQLHNQFVVPSHPTSYSVPVTPVTGEWQHHQLPRILQEQTNASHSLYPSPPNIMVSREHGMIQVLSMSHTYGNEGCPLSVRVNVDFPPSPVPSPENGGPAPDTGNKTLRIRIGPLPISTKLGDVSPLKTSSGGERYENLVMSAEVPSLLALMGQKVVEGNVSFEVYVEVLDARGNILDSKMAGTFMYTSGVVTSAYGEYLRFPLYASKFTVLPTQIRDWRLQSHSKDLVNRYTSIAFRPRPHWEGECLMTTGPCSPASRRQCHHIKAVWNGWTILQLIPPMPGLVDRCNRGLIARVSTIEMETK